RSIFGTVAFTLVEGYIRESLGHKQTKKNEEPIKRVPSYCNSPLSCPSLCLRANDNDNENDNDNKMEAEMEIDIENGSKQRQSRFSLDELRLNSDGEMEAEAKMDGREQEDMAEEEEEEKEEEEEEEDEEEGNDNNNNNNNNDEEEEEESKNSVDALKTKDELLDNIMPFDTDMSLNDNRPGSTRKGENMWLCYERFPLDLMTMIVCFLDPLLKWAIEDNVFLSLFIKDHLPRNHRLDILQSYNTRFFDYRKGLAHVYYYYLSSIKRIERFSVKCIHINNVDYIPPKLFINICKKESHNLKLLVIQSPKIHSQWLSYVFHHYFNADIHKYEETKKKPLLHLEQIFLKDLSKEILENKHNVMYHLLEFVVKNARYANVYLSRKKNMLCDSKSLNKSSRHGRYGKHSLRYLKELVFEECGNHCDVHTMNAFMKGLLFNLAYQPPLLKYIKK
ncbi:hypothetical protein RFI_19998, partial [Reticulomyxa filosa]